MTTETIKIRKTKQFASYTEASQATIAAGITSKHKYAVWYKTASILLPASPEKTYKPEWVSWEQFLSKKPVLSKVKSNLASYEEARDAAIAAGITTGEQYGTWYKTADIILPRNPYIIYKDQWVSWFEFLAKRDVTYEDAREAVITAGIKSISRYKAWYKSAGIALPSHPEDIYKDQWVSWPVFLGKQKPDSIVSYNEARNAAIAAGIKSIKEYCNWYKTVAITLPRDPRLAYDSEWINWFVFLGKKTAGSN